MSTSVASGSSLKAHNSRRGHVGDRAESRSTSPDIDDQDSVINLEDELQQQLENEMSASYDDDDSDSKSATGRSATAEPAAVDQSDNESVAGDGDSSSSDNDSDDDDDDDEIDAALFGGGGAQDSNDEEIDLDFVDPPTAEESKPAQPASDDEDDSASDDEFETVEVSAGALQPPPRFDAPILSTAEAGLKRKRQNPFHIGDRHIVERYKDEKPSMTVHMFDSHYRFEDQEGVFLYNESTRFFFDALNEGRIPVELVDVLSEFNSCRYYEGCLIVEVRDYRRPTRETHISKFYTSELLTSSAFGNKAYGNLSQQPADEPSTSTRPSHVIPEPGAAAAASLHGAAPIVYRKVMKPTAETLYIDLVLASEQTPLTETQLLEIEGQILLATEEPLTLEPDFQVSRVANATRHIEYGHMLPRKRSKYNSAEIEAEQAEREEKRKLMTLMDDRANRNDFIPNFSRLSQISEWRHKKLVKDAEVYPSALPPVLPPVPGKKAVAKKGRSQVSQFHDGRKVLRTLRFVHNTSGRSTHTTFHVLELPDGGGLQGMMRWGSLPDTGINGGSREFSFPNEEIMLMHIDNMKLLLSIESHRLIYDSAYPNGVPTAGPPPSLVTPTISPRTSTNMVPTSGSSVAGVGSSSVAGPSTAVQSPAAASSVAASPDIAAKASPSAAKGETTAKPKASVAKKGSRKNSPQPKQKKATSARPSAEPELDDALPKGSAASKAVAPKTKAAGKGTAATETSKHTTKEGSPSSVSSGESASAVTEPVSPVDEEESTLVLVTPGPPKPKKSASKASLASSSQATVVLVDTTDPAAATGKAPAKKKGARLASKTTTAPKEKKPRAKPKAKSTSVAPPSETEILAATALPAQGSVDGVAKAPSDDDDDDDDVPLVQNPGATSARVSGDEAPAVNPAAQLLMSPPPMAPPFPAIGNSPAGVLPSQSAMAQLSARMAGPGRPPFEIPMHITREYLEANPEQYALLRQQIHAHQLLQQQQQQQQQQGVRNMNNPSAGPMISPQIRPNVAHPGMATMAQIPPTMQSGPAISAPPGPSPSMSANSALTPGLPGSVAQVNPVLGSPAMRPALGPGAPNVMTAAQQQQLQQQQQQQQQQQAQIVPTREEIQVIQQFMMVSGIQIQGPHDPLVAVLVAKARSGELGAVVFERYQQAIAAQRQQQAAGANPLIRPAGNSIGVQQPIHGGAPVQNSPALVNSLPPNAPPMTPAMGMARPPVAGLPHAIRPSKLPRDSANPSLQDRAVLLEMMQRQREAQLSGSVAGTQMPTTGAPIQQQQQLQQQQLQQMQQQQQQPSALAVLQQRQQQINLAAMAARGGAGGSAAMINPAGVVPTIQTPMVRPMQQPGVTVAPQSRPAAPMMTSPANVPQVMTAAQRQVLQQNALANMTPQQQQEVYMRMQQARQQAAMAPQQQPQISVAMVVQQLLAGQISPEQLPPQAISILWQSAQSHMNPEQRMALQRILSSRVQQIQNNAAQAGAVRPGAAQ